MPLTCVLARNRTRKSLRRGVFGAAIAAVALLSLHSVILPMQCNEGLTPAYLDSLPEDMRILARRFSTTGLISVIEHRIGDRWVRVLRCDHSILGGVWLDPAVTNMSQAEAIYITFHVQEAVRLFLPPKPGLRALVIGLGVGTVINGLEAHGVLTTAVEIDPAVVEFAQHHFHMCDPSGGTRIADARQILSARTLDLHSYDFVVHDVFTGGALPFQLFQPEIWDAIRRVMKPRGVVAIVSLPPHAQTETALNAI